MVPQVLMFVFLLLTSAVAVWRDVGHSQLTIATVWNVTNTVILGGFVPAGVREHRRLLNPLRAAAEPSVPTVARPRAAVILPPTPHPVPSATLASSSAARR